MTSQWEQVLGLIGAAAAAVGGPRVIMDGAERLSKSERMRRDIDRDLGLLERVTWDSPEAKQLRRSVDLRMGELAKYSGMRRDPFGASLGVAFIIAGVIALIGAYSTEGWLPWLLWPLGAVTLLLGLAGVAEDGGRAERDVKGNRVKK